MEAVVQVIQQNIRTARRILRSAVERVRAQPPRTCACSRAVAGTIMTSLDRVPPEARERLQLILGKYL